LRVKPPRHVRQRPAWVDALSSKDINDLGAVSSGSGSKGESWDRAALRRFLLLLTLSLNFKRRDGHSGHGPKRDLSQALTVSNLARPHWTRSPMAATTPLTSSLAPPPKTGYIVLRNL
jgi:hypothetical protein